jgi:hypothetical protein
VGFILLLPVWSVQFPPLLDYPNHLASGFVLGHLHDPAYQFQRYYAGDWKPYPYIASDFLLMTLCRVLPAQFAGKVLLSLGVLAFPLSAWFFLRRANPGENALALWTLLAAHNVFFLYGFLGFFFSLSLMFVSAGLWLRWLERPSVWRWAAACAAVTAAYLMHFFGFAFTALIVAFYSISRPRWREWLYSAGMFLPGTLFYFVFSRVASHQTNGVTFGALDDKLESFWRIMQSHSTRLDQVTLAAVVVLFICGWVKNREFRWNGRWCLVAAGLLVTYAALPVGFGAGWDIDIRVLPVLFVTLFATVRMGRRAWWLAPLALILFTVRTVELTQYFRAGQPKLQGMARAFALTPPNARVLPIVAGHDEDPIEQDYPHFWAYGVVERGWFSPYLSTLPGLLPLRLTADVYAPDGFWDLTYAEPPDWEQVRDNYDYVWAYDVPQFHAALSRIGERAYASGKLELYRIRK